MGIFFLSFILWYMTMDSSAAVQSLPGRPTNIHVLADSFNIGVQWEPPTETFGTITNYIVSFRILPNTTEFVNIVSGQDNISLIAVGTHIGRLYKIRVRAQNDVGIGPYSDVRYIRINCSNTFDIYPNTSIELTSPGYDTKNSLEAGVMCSWALHTDPAYVLEIQIVHMELTSNHVTSDPSNNCSRSSSYIDIGGVWRFCDSNYAENTPKMSSLSNLTVTLKTGLNVGGRGFKMIVRSVIRLPGPPLNIHVSTTNYAIIVTWQQPIDNTLPVTSYVIRYNVINSNRLFRIPVSPSMRRFSLNVQKYEGRLLQLNISAAIGFEEGTQSRSFFIRAPCQHQIKVQPGQHFNISSPNYPQHYPKSVVCSWHVTSDPETELYVTFLDFRLEDTSFCSNDYVLFSFKVNREPDCSRIRIPKTINTKTSAFNMTFVTDDQREFEGFLLQIYSRGKIDKTDYPSRTILATTETTLTDVSKDAYDKPTQSASYSNVLNSEQLISMSSLMSDIPELYVTGETTPVYSQNGQHDTTIRHYNDGDVIGQEATEQSMNKTITTKHPLNSKVTLPRVSERLRSDNNRVTSSVTVTRKLQNLSSANNRVPSFVTLPSDSGTLNAYTNTAHGINIPTYTSPSSNKIPTSEEDLETVTLVNGVRDVSEGLEANTTRMTNMTGDVKEMGVGPDEFNMTGLIIGSIVSLLVVFVVVFGIYKWRKQKSKMKINYSASVRYKRGHVELHDIIQRPDIRNQNNYDTFAVNKVQETSFINVSGKRKNSTINTGTRNTFVHIGDTRKVVINDDGTGQSVINDVGNRKAKRLSRKNHTYGTKSPNGRPRRKHNSFPYSFGKRKVHQDIEKTLAAFKFIEDKEMLETQIRRKQCRQRTYSL